MENKTFLLEGMISVIVPVYNIEMYLDKCINSIINQSYSNLEIILIDDGSTDNSGVICDKFAQKDTRIKVIHKNNGGPSEARNIGLSIAKGFYIAFVDADDYIHKDMYKILHDYLCKNNCDIAECDYVNIFNVNTKLYINEENITTKIYSRKSAHRELICHRDLIEKCWNKLYKKELFTNIEFSLMKFYADTSTIVRVYSIFGSGLFCTQRLLPKGQ